MGLSERENYFMSSGNNDDYGHGQRIVLYAVLTVLFCWRGFWERANEERFEVVWWVTYGILYVGIVVVVWLCGS